MFKQYRYILERHLPLLEAAARRGPLVRGPDMLARLYRAASQEIVDPSRKSNSPVLITSLTTAEHRIVTATDSDTGIFVQLAFETEKAHGGLLTIGQKWISESKHQSETRTKVW